MAALSDRRGTAEAGSVLGRIDENYEDQHQGGSGVSTQLPRQLADPRPKDLSTTEHLSSYKNLDHRWHEWNVVVTQCRQVAVAMARAS